MSRILIAAVMLCSVCGRADAQRAPFEVEERTTAGWTFTPGASLGLLWDSGINTSSNPFVEKVFQRWVGIVNPRAALDFNSRRTHFNTGYSGSAEKYWSSNTNWEQRVRTTVRQVVTRRFSATADLAYAAVPTTDRLELVDGAIPFIEVNSTWLDAGAGFQARLGPRTNLDAGIRFERVHLDRPAELASFGTLLDGQSYSPTLGLTRTFTERLTVGGHAEYRQETINGIDETFDIGSVLGEFTYRVSSATSLTVGGGASRLGSRATGAVTVTPTYRVGLAHQMRRMKVDARYDRSFQQIFGFGTLGKSDTFSAVATMPLADRQLYLQAVVAYNNTHPVDALATGFDFNSLWLDARVGRQLGRWVRAEAFVTVAAQGSLNSFFPAANRHRIGVQFVTSKALRIQ